MGLKYDLSDALIKARMTSEAMLIVEGKDDCQIYFEMAKIAQKNVFIYQVNEFENYESGCTGVVKCMETLQPKFIERVDNINWVLGIIDRDMRFYRGEIPNNLKGLFITKYYSIESYFATGNNLKKLLAKISYILEKDIQQKHIDIIEDNFKISIDQLYLISLEAFKNAGTIGYDKLLGYDYSHGKITEQGFLNYILPLLKAKESLLQQFADTKNVNIEDFKLIAKGKWYLHWYVKRAYFVIKQLKGKCKNKDIPQCRSCMVENYNDCLFGLKSSFTEEQLHNEMLNFIDESECADIIAAISVLN